MSYPEPPSYADEQDPSMLPYYQSTLSKRQFYPNSNYLLTPPQDHDPQFSHSYPLHDPGLYQRQSHSYQTPPYEPPLLNNLNNFGVLAGYSNNGELNHGAVWAHPHLRRPNWEENQQTDFDSRSHFDPSNTLDRSNNIDPQLLGMQIADDRPAGTEYPVEQNTDFTSYPIDHLSSLQDHTYNGVDPSQPQQFYEQRYDTSNYHQQPAGNPFAYNEDDLLLQFHDEDRKRGHDFENFPDNHFPTSNDFQESSLGKRRRKSSMRYVDQADPINAADHTTGRVSIKREAAKGHRSNNKTSGKSKRTEAIRDYDPSEKYDYSFCDNRLDDWWSSNGFPFMYDKWGLLVNDKFTVEQIYDFIYEHPGNSNPDPRYRMKIWIQRCPTDSGMRRVKKTTFCKFAKCPTRMHKQPATIMHGHFRVAFDENWNRHGVAADPNLAAGFVHLDCLERFLDFPEICRRFDVEVDYKRAVLQDEPHQRWRASFRENSFDCKVAISFVDACQNFDSWMSWLNEPENFNGYPGPVPADDQGYWDWEKEEQRYRTTLCGRMNNSMFQGGKGGRPNAQQNQFKTRITAVERDLENANMFLDYRVDYTNVMKHLGSIWFFQKARAIKREAIKEREEDFTKARTKRLKTEKGKKVQKTTRSKGHSKRSRGNPIDSMSPVRPRRSSRFEEAEESDEEENRYLIDDPFTDPTMCRKTRSQAHGTTKRYIDVNDAIDIDPALFEDMRREDLLLLENSDDEWKPHYE